MSCYSKKGEAEDYSKKGEGEFQLEQRGRVIILTEGKL